MDIKASTFPKGPPAVIHIRVLSHGELRLSHSLTWRKLFVVPASELPKYQQIFLSLLNMKCDTIVFTVDTNKYCATLFSLSVLIIEIITQYKWWLNTSQFNTAHPSVSSRYLPILRGFPARYIYDPWNAPEEVQKAAKCIIGVHYPKPMVNHAEASRINIERMKQIYQQLSCYRGLGMDMTQIFEDAF